ncbi:hypothetical protein [Psychrobacillus sp. FSL K6-1464]|uniref:hypothetical protein n=1 Tax=Psychrobacillus sp. FSL K6-1464 TaxID=2921545 RepID=UPI0030F51651
MDGLLIIGVFILVFFFASGSFIGSYYFNAAKDGSEYFLKRYKIFRIMIMPIIGFCGLYIFRESKDVDGIVFMLISAGFYTSILLLKIFKKK